MLPLATRLNSSKSDSTDLDELGRVAGKNACPTISFSWYLGPCVEAGSWNVLVAPVGDVAEEFAQA